MMFRSLSLALAAAIVLAACGGGGGSSNRAPAPQTTTSPQPAGEGGLTLLLGDNALDGVEAVIMQISAVRLLGEDGQIDLTLEEVPTEVDLLALQNLTESLFEGDVPEGDYSKIRLEVDSLQIIEVGNPNPVDVQLVANGKVDLNPQGPFSIIPGEELVIEIDIDLDRSIHLITTGNSRYRFRPVVFVDVIDRADEPRMTRIFGEIAAREEEGEPEFDLCEVDSEDCFDITLPAELQILDEQDQPLDGFTGLVDTTFHMFGVYFVEAGTEGEEDRLRFRPILAIQATEDGIDSVFGDVSALNLPASFELDGPTDHSVALSDITLVLDRYGEGDGVSIALENAVEVWARTELMTDLDALLVIVRPDEDPDSLEGELVEILDGQLNLSDGQCVLIGDDTEYQLVEEMGDVVESSPLDLAGLMTLAENEESIEIAAFGELGVECLDASFVVASVEL